MRTEWSPRRAAVQLEEIVNRRVELHDFGGCGGLGTQPERVVCCAVREYADVIEGYLEGGCGGEGRRKEFGCACELVCGDKREEDVDVGHPARDVSVVVVSDDLNAGPERLVWDEA